MGTTTITVDDLQRRADQRDINEWAKHQPMEIRLACEVEIDLTTKEIVRSIWLPEDEQGRKYVRNGTDILRKETLLVGRGLSWPFTIQ